ncbi:MAG: type IV toxin-antitoxin system AbiEi family antitoxin domain-containing protein [Desulfuromonadaceae bacterium]|nr:type IV toxin-antitoxin system AbiEi family antitoxin domain-containing protein [Desulfuromonadaceae bacterium]
MSTNSLHSSKNLKAVLFSLPKGMPVTTCQMLQLGISRQLVHRYVINGWLETLGYGYFLRAGDELTRNGAVAALESQGVDVHIGGKSALSQKGVAHYLAFGKDKLTLFRVTRKKVPQWFTSRFPCEIRMSRLFEEECALEKRLYVSRLDGTDSYSPFVSEPERALLEMLDDVPQKQSLDEARKIMEPLFTLRSDLLQNLLQTCTRIKVKRLFFSLAEELKLPVLQLLDVSRINFGSDSVYIRTLKGNSLILQHPGKGLHG